MTERKRGRSPLGRPAAALPWLKEACSALTWSQSGSTNQVIACANVAQPSPAQPSRWACAWFGPMPGLDGIADMLWAVVPKDRLRRELSANTACAGLPWEGCQCDSHCCQRSTTGSAPARSTPARSPPAGDLGERPWGEGSPSESPGMLLSARPLMARLRVLGCSDGGKTGRGQRRRTWAFLLPGALCLLQGWKEPLSLPGMR